MNLNLMGRAVTLAATSVLLSAIASAQAPQLPTTSLPKLLIADAIQAALKQSPSLARMAHLAAAAGDRIREAQSGSMPSVAIQGAATNGPAGAPAFGPPGLQGMAADPLKKHYAGGLNLILPLFDFGRTQHLVGARRALMEAARADSATQRANVILGVQEAYLNALRQQQVLEVHRANFRRREATVEQVRAHVEAGLRADVDLQLANANLAEARVALAAAENDVHLAFASLNNAMGDTKMSEYRLEPPPPFGATPATADGLMKLAVMQRPELRSAAQQVVSADQSIRAAKSDLLPRVDSIASVGWVNPSKLITDNKPFGVGLMLTVPLYTGGAAEGRIAEERERRLAAVASRREVEEAVKLQVARAWLNVQTHQAQLVSAQAQITSAHSSFDQAAERFRLQLSTFEELLSAEAAGIRADTQFVNAQYDLQQAQAELDWATGATPGAAPKTAPVKRR